MSDPIVLLLGLGSAAHDRRPMPEQVADWLIGGVHRYLDGQCRLDEALGLCGDGWPASTRHRYRQRDGRLRRACDLLGGDPAALSREIRRFESRVWPRWRDLPAPPEQATAVQRELWDAFRVGVRIPGSRKQLARICER